MEGQKHHPRAFSFEFFPPKTPEGVQKLGTTWHQLAQLKPRFFSVTYGAGGSTRERTLSTVIDIRQAGFHAAPHISCVGATRERIVEQLKAYQALAGMKQRGIMLPADEQYLDVLRRNAGKG